MHWSTNQTPFFANHDLHLKFNIQGANKIMKHVAKNKALWSEGVSAQLASNLENVRRQYKKNVYEHYNETTKLQG